MDISEISGTGTGGRVTKKDIESYIESAERSARSLPKRGLRLDPIAWRSTTATASWSSRASGGQSRTAWL